MESDRMTEIFWVLVIVSGTAVQTVPMGDKDACFKAVLAIAAIENEHGDPFRLSFCMNREDGTVVR
jgi:hypothetical protein